MKFARLQRSETSRHFLIHAEEHNHQETSFLVDSMANCDSAGNKEKINIYAGVNSGNYKMTMWKYIKCTSVPQGTQHS